MKVILSRKGFDSESGGMMSPIMPNGDLLSMPIPSGGDPTSYRDVVYRGRALRDVLLDLDPQFNYGDCHLDPDLVESRHLRKPRGWKPGFGQRGAPSSFLLNTARIEKGDIFLFFGNFHRVEMHEGRLRYVRRTGDFYRDRDLHIVWGYLQVGEIVSDPKRIRREYGWHPHALDFRRNDPSNVIFAPTRCLSFSAGLPGCGLLGYDEKRVLTLPGYVRSVWRKNPAYALGNIIGSRKNGSPDISGGIRFGGQWQELPLKDTAASLAFAKRMILD